MTTTTTTPDQPPRLFRLMNRLMNPFMRWLLCSPWHGVVSGTYLLISFTGRKSGKTYATPVQYAQSAAEVYIVTSAGYTWWKNLRGGAPVELRLRGQRVRGQAETSADPVVIYDQLTRLYPRLTDAQKARFVPGKVAIMIQLQPTA